MRHYLLFLLRNRIRAQPLTWPWLRMWGKRVFSFPALLTLLVRMARLSARGVRIGPLAIIGNHVEFNGNPSRLSMGRESVIGSHVHLALHHDIRLGSFAVINDGCALLTASHDVDSPDWAQVKAPIVIGDYAWIATRSIILPGVTIGYGAVVGAGAVVTKDIPAFHVVGGNPARIIKQRNLRRPVYSPSRFVAAIEAWVGLSTPDLPS